MATTLSGQLSDLQAKLNEIDRRVAAQSALIADLEEQNQLLAEENRELKEKLSEKTVDEEFLKISHLLVGKPDDLVMARRRIAGMIRTVTSCIDILEHGEI